MDQSAKAARFFLNRLYGPGDFSERDEQFERLVPALTRAFSGSVATTVMHLAEYVWVLAQGRLIAEGEPRAVTADTKVIEAYLGHGAAARIAAMA